MKKFKDLLSFELERIKKGYFVLVGTIIGMEILSVVMTANNYLHRFESFQRETQGNMIDFLEYWGPIDFYHVQMHTLFDFSIILGIIWLGTYALAIWYRDWYGKNNLSYRLLSLPGSRMSVFFAKLATILFLIAGLLAVQVILLEIGESLLKLLIPSELFQSLPAGSNSTSNELLSLVLPPGILDFILHYTVGVTGLIAVKMVILMNLSYKWKGLAVGLVILLAMLLGSMLLFDAAILKYLFTIEVIWITIALSIVISAILVIFIKKLINNQISI